MTTVLSLALTPVDVAYSVATLIVIALIGPLYQRWRRARVPDRVPNGFGVFIAPVALGAAIVADARPEFVAALAIASVATLAYWLDDLIELSARLRIAISVAAGFGIGACWFVSPETGWLAAIGGSLAAAVVCVVLTNAVNFYDGADLNLATYIGLSALLIFAFAPEHREWTPVALATIAFLVPFAVMNARPRTIYLGDSGSFAFAALLTLMAVAFVADIGSLPPEAAIAAALPTLDVAYVFAVRVREGHDLMSRNYLHLYQRLNRAYAGFGYLLPQIVNTALCLIGAALLQTLGMGRIVSVIVAMVGVTVPVYFAIRRVFLVGQSIGPAATNG